VVLHQGPLQLLILILALGLHPEPLVLLEWVARGMAADGISPPRFLLAGWMTGSTLAAAVRLRGGAEGWVIHLPVSARNRRYAMLGGLLAAQVLPILAGLGFWAAGGVLSGRFPVLIPVSVAATAVAAAQVALPEDARGFRLLSLLALVPAARGGWWLLAAAGILAFLIRRVPPPATRRSRKALVGSRRPGLFPWRVASRAVGGGVLFLHLEALAPAAAAFLVLRNNPDLTPAGTAMTVRGGCGLALAVLVLALSGRLVARRPPWAWLRSLPALVVALFLDPPSVFPVAVLAVYLVLRAAGAMRGEGEGMTSLGGPVTAEILLLPLLAALHPWIGPALGLLVPGVWVHAVRMEKRRKVSRLHERRYLQVGDPAA